MKKIVILFLLISLLALSQTKLLPDQFGGLIFKTGNHIQTFTPYSGEFLRSYPNFAVVTYRTEVPKESGVCFSDSLAKWAADSEYIYFCVPNKSKTAYIWVRTSVNSVW